MCCRVVSSPKPLSKTGSLAGEWQISAIRVRHSPDHANGLAFLCILCRMKAPRRSRTDAATKILFIGEVIADLICIRLPALADELELDNVQALPTEFIDMDRSRRIGDAAYGIPFARGGKGHASQRFAIASGEFQDRNDSDMLARVREYTTRMLAASKPTRLIGPEPPLVLPFVIHTGTGRWRAGDGTEPMESLSPTAAREVAPFQPQAYIAVDIGDAASLPAGAPDNRFLAAARLVRCREANGLLAQLIEERRRFPGAEHERLRAGMHAWVEEALLGLEPTGLKLPTFEQMENAKESEMVQLYEDRGLRWREEWREEGQRDLLIAQAGQRFGAAAGERLAEALDGHPTAETLSMAGNLIIACETSEEFFRRLAR